MVFFISDNSEFSAAAGQSGNVNVTNGAKFVIRPNSAFNTQSWRWVFALLAVVCLGIALRFAMLGYWMILPFAILDILAVGLILLLTVRRLTYAEKIIITSESVTIRHVQRKNRHRWIFPLYWTQVRLEKPRHRWYAHRLLVGCKGKWIEVGQCLTEAERESLAKSLRGQILGLAHEPG